jgi:hypothetical protein
MKKTKKTWVIHNLGLLLSCCPRIQSFCTNPVPSIENMKGEKHRNTATYRYRTNTLMLLGKKENPKVSSGQGKNRASYGH